MWYGYSRFDLMIIGRSLGSSVLGIYSMASNLAKMPMERAHVAITPLLLPLYSRARSEPKEVGRVLRRMTRYNALIIFPLVAGFGVVADDVVSVLLGNKWNDSVTPLRILCVYVIVRAVLALMPPALLALGELRRILVFNSVCLVFMPLGFILGLPWGPSGVAFAWALVYPLLAIALLVRPTLDCSGLTIRSYCGSLWRPVTATTLMVLAVILGGLLPVQGATRLVFRIAIGGAVYFSCVRALEGPIVEEIRLLLKDAGKGIGA